MDGDVLFFERYVNSESVRKIIGSLIKRELKRKYSTIDNFVHKVSLKGLENKSICTKRWYMGYVLKGELYGTPSETFIDRPESIESLIRLKQIVHALPINENNKIITYIKSIDNRFNY